MQAFFEFQTLICQLTGMDVANASLYDGGSAVAEAVLMAMNVTGRSGARSSSPRASIRNIARRWPPTSPTSTPHVETLPTPDGFLDPDDLKRAVDDQTACVVVQHPNFFGCLEEVEALADVAHARRGAVRRQLRSDQPGPAEAAGPVRGRHRRGRGAVPGQRR